MDYMSRYLLLNNKDWLVQKYVNDGLSTVKIAILAGAKQSNSVRQALLRFGIRPRNSREGQVVNRVDMVIDDPNVIDGSLLGDASLGIYNKASDISCPYLKKTNKYLDHLVWFAWHVTKEEPPNIKKQTYTVEWKGKLSQCQAFTLRTNSSEKLKPYFKRWYPESNNFKKIVPRDLNITSELLLHWFLDDGCSIERNRSHEYLKTGWEQRTRQVFVVLSSEGFCRNENDYLVDKINREFDLKATVCVTNTGSCWQIRIPQSTSQKFFNIIGGPPVKSLEYKWKII
jgi:hypothetical protein